MPSSLCNLKKQLSWGKVGIEKVLVKTKIFSLFWNSRLSFPEWTHVAGGAECCFSCPISVPHSWWLCVVPSLLPKGNKPYLGRFQFKIIFLPYHVIRKLSADLPQHCLYEMNIIVACRNAVDIIVEEQPVRNWASSMGSFFPQALLYYDTFCWIFILCSFLRLPFSFCCILNEYRIWVKLKKKKTTQKTVQGKNQRKTIKNSMVVRWEEREEGMM